RDRAAVAAASADRGFPGRGAHTFLVRSRRLAELGGTDAGGSKRQGPGCRFLAYSCSNCLRSLPYARAWYEKYKDQGLVVIGVHTPEFAFEKNIGNVKKTVTDLKLEFPIAIDNDYAIW